MNPRILTLLAVLVILPPVLGGCLDQDESPSMTREPVTMDRLNYPETRTVDQQDDYHGTVVPDPYRWLEDADSAETARWVEAQNAVTFGFLESIPERTHYEKRLTEIWDYTRYGVPRQKGKRTFFTRNDGLQDQSVLFVQDSPEAEPRVLLDPNTLSDDGTVALGGYSISDDGRYLAWATNVSGSDWRTWYVRDVDTGQDLDDKIEWSKFSGASWNKDATGFYYSRYDAPKAGEALEGSNYFQKLFYHRLGTSQDQDQLVYERPDQKEWGFSGSVAEDGRYLVISVWQGSADKNRLYYKDLFDKSLVVRKLLDDFDAQYTFLHNEGPIFYLATNLEAPRQRIISIDITQPARENWKTVVPESEDPIDGVSVVNNSFVVTYMHDVANEVKVFDFAGHLKNEIALPGLGSVGGFGGKSTDTETYYVFNSYLNPSEIYHHNFTTGQSTLFRAPEIDFDFSGYTTTRVFYSSKDGTRVPLFLTHRKDLELDGTNPTILYGYGGFNASMNPDFRISLLPWIENGGVYAVANIRGGGEYGQEWHKAGTLKNKQNVFDDFIAAAEYLIREGFTSPSKLAVQGGSNGGTLVGAVINQRPELFAAALPAVGVMDMLRFQLFTIGWAWTSDYGSSDDPELFPVLRAYSPYHNLVPGTEYPAVMVTTADHDDRVVPGHSFKYAARLQACQAGNLPVIIRVQTKAGHGGGMPTSMVIQEVADRYAFLHRTLGM
jgi:prolyl oligopeptidase|nr:prolyl oligopeptidase family serine peptidase [Candidatus Krumholzibacteria bacterium]